MNQRLTTVSILMGALALTGACSKDTPSGAPTGLCTTGNCPARTYVFSELALAQDDEGTTAGFNIDGTADTVCGQSDFTGPAPDNITGVDNALGADLASNVDSIIQTAVDNGSGLLAVTIEGLDSFTNDDEVNLNLYVAEVQSGATLMHASSGRISGGQTFDINAQSFTDSSHTTSTLRFTGARIVNGRVQAGPAGFALNANVMGTPLVLELHDTQLWFSVSESGLTLGVLGGAFDVAEISAAINSAPALAPLASTLISVIENNADLEPNGGVCTQASVALTAVGVPATLSDNVVVPVRDAGTGADGG